MAPCARFPVRKPPCQRSIASGHKDPYVNGGASLPKLQFTIFVPAAEFFRALRTSQASLDLQDEYAVSFEDNGLERFLTGTWRPWIEVELIDWGHRQLTLEWDDCERRPLGGRLPGPSRQPRARFR
jgi:hypothetical protein